jgi:hypothetical protein
VQSGHLRGLADVVVGFDQGPRNKDTLEFPLGVVEENAAVDHLLDELGEIITHHEAILTSAILALRILALGILALGILASGILA